MITRKTYEFKANISNEQQHKLKRKFELTRILYNELLANTLEFNFALGEYPDFDGMYHAYTNSILVKYPDLKYLSDPVVRYEIRKVQDFYKKRKDVTHEPKMLGHISARSYLLGYANAIRFIERSNKISTPWFKNGIELKVDKTIEGTIKSASIKRAKKGSYYIVINTEVFE